MILRHTVGVHTYIPGERTEYGYRERAWEPPLEEPGAPRQIYGCVPRGAEEVGVNPENIALTDVDLLAPPGFQIGPDDVVDLPEGQFQVVGFPLNYTVGPFGMAPGVVVHLKRSG